MQYNEVAGLRRAAAALFFGDAGRDAAMPARNGGVAGRGARKAGEPGHEAGQPV
jgi:hypothetical protein